MMNTSLTQLDIRYCRTVQRLQTILAEGLKDICLLYLKMTRTKKALDELPDFKIVFTSINSSEDQARAELRQKQMETLDKMISELNKMGISFENDMYSKTRDKLIKEFFGQEFLETLQEDEKIQPVTAPNEDPRNMGGGNSGGPDIDVNVGGPDDIISGPEVNSDEGTEDTETGEENVETDIETGDEVDLDTGITPPADGVGREIG